MKQLNEKWSDRVAKALRLAADDLEKFSLKANLGRMEAISLYKKVRRQYNSFSNRLLGRLKKYRQVSNEKLAEVSMVIKSFTENKTTEDSVENSSSFSAAILSLRKQIRLLDLPKHYKSELEMELEKFYIKLKILRLRMEGKKVDTKQKILQRKSVWRKRLNNFRNRIERVGRRETKQSIIARLNQEWVKLKSVFA